MGGELFLLVFFVMAAAMLPTGWTMLRTAWKRKDECMTAGQKLALVLLLVFGGGMFLLGLLMGGCCLLYGGAMLSAKKG